MKKLLKFLIVPLLFTILSCDSDNDNNNSQVVNLKIDHFQQPAISLDVLLVFRVQEEEKIGTDNWTNFYNTIEGFSYELGNTYLLQVEKETIKNPPQDASSVKYVLKEVIEKQPTNTSQQFQVKLKSEMMHPQPFITGNTFEGFKLLNKINIDCNNFCDSIEEIIEMNAEVSGIFTHTSNNAYKLIDILIE